MASEDFDRGRLQGPRWVAVAALVLGLAFDVGTTALGLRVGLAESNPAGVAVLSAVGVGGLVAAKLAASVVLLAQLHVCRRRFGDTEQAVAFGGCLLVAGVWMLAATWNTALIAVSVGGFL